MLRGAFRKDTCRDKTERGNVHVHKRSARRKARALRERFGIPVVHYKCRCCPFWHVGGQRPAHEVVKALAAS